MQPNNFTRSGGPTNKAKVPFQVMANRVADVTAAAEILQQMLTAYNMGYEKWINHHWTGVPTFTADHGHRQRDTEDTDNGKAMYALADAVLTAWKDLKSTMATAVQARAFGYTTVLLRPRRK